LKNLFRLSAGTGAPDVLIDFARSAIGPFAIDAAKFVSDILIRLPDVRGDKLISWDDASEPITLITSPLHEPFDLTEGDQKLFTLFLIAFLAQALKYADVDSETKGWIRHVLTNAHIANS
jgi:hypothetical protein